MPAEGGVVLPGLRSTLPGFRACLSDRFSRYSPGPLPNPQGTHRWVMWCYAMPAVQFLKLIHAVSAAVKPHLCPKGIPWAFIKYCIVTHGMSSPAPSAGSFISIPFGYPCQTVPEMPTQRPRFTSIPMKNRSRLCLSNAELVPLGRTMNARSFQKTVWG